jgi:sugar phosphate permease
MQDKNDKSKISHWLVIFSLVFAGEMVFSLPFHVARFFRPTLLGAFNLTNSNFGDILSVYGIMAMLAYFPGGIIADKFPAGKLMAISLFATAIGGIYMIQIPGNIGLRSCK